MSAEYVEHDPRENLRPRRKPAVQTPATPPQLPQHRAQVNRNGWVMAILLILVGLFLTFGSEEKAREKGHSPWHNPFKDSEWQDSGRR